MSECKHIGYTEVTTDGKGFLCYNCGEDWGPLSILERTEKAEAERDKMHSTCEQLEAERNDLKAEVQTLLKRIETLGKADVEREAEVDAMTDYFSTHSKGLWTAYQMRKATEGSNDES